MATFGCRAVASCDLRAGTVPLLPWASRPLIGRYGLGGLRVNYLDCNNSLRPTVLVVIIPVLYKHLLEMHNLLFAQHIWSPTTPPPPSKWRKTDAVQPASLIERMSAGHALLSWQH
jgi:hypothetical protein